MTDRTCAKCGRELVSDEQPWTVTGWSDEDDLDADPGEPAFVCEDCFDGFGGTDPEPDSTGPEH